MTSKEILMSKDIKPSLQRIIILDHIDSLNSHFTSESIYSQIQEKDLALSKATVYNTLNLFVEKGLISENTIDGKERFFDYNKDSHSHFICTSCGDILDVETPALIPTSENLKDFEIHREVVNFFGICPKCKKKEKENI